MVALGGRNKSPGFEVILLNGVTNASLVSVQKISGVRAEIM